MELLSFLDLDLFGFQEPSSFWLCKNEASVSHETFNTDVHESLHIFGVSFGVNHRNIFKAKWHNYPHFLVNHTRLLNNKNVISHTANPLYSPKWFRFIRSKNLGHFQRTNIWPLMHIQNNIPKSRKTVFRKELQQLESNVNVILIVASKVTALNDFTHLDVWLQKCLYNQFKNPSHKEDNDNVSLISIVMLHFDYMLLTSMIFLSNWNIPCGKDPDLTCAAWRILAHVLICSL